MTQDNKDKMEEVIAEILSAHYLPKTSGPAIASVVMQRLEYENLLGTTGSTDPTTYKIGVHAWTEEELRTCTVFERTADYSFVSWEGRSTEIHKSWFDDNIWAAMSLLARIVLERKAAGEIK